MHLRFLKSILGVRKQTSYIAVYGELGRIPMCAVRKIRILKYWCKIINSQDYLLYKIYSQKVNHLNANASFILCWAQNVRNDLGFNYPWDALSISYT